MTDHNYPPTSDPDILTDDDIAAFLMRAQDQNKLGTVIAGAGALLAREELTKSQCRANGGKL